MAYDEKFRNLKITPIGTSTNVRKVPSAITSKSPVLHTLKSGETLLTMGILFDMPADGVWYQVALPKIVDGRNYGYVRHDVVKFVNSGDGELLVKQLAINDKSVWESLVRSSALVATLKQKGVNTTNFETKWRELGERLKKRQDELKNSTLVKIQTGLSNTYTTMVAKMKSLFGINDGGVISIPLSVIIGVSVIGGAAAAFALYKLFKPKYDESTKDLVISQDLENLLSKAEPAVATKIKAELEQQIDKSYNQGKTDGSFFGLGQTIKYAAFAVLAIIGISYFKKQKNGSK